MICWKKNCFLTPFKTDVVNWLISWLVKWLQLWLYPIKGVNVMKEPSRTHTPLSGQTNQIKPIPSRQHEFSGAPGNAGSPKDLNKNHLPASPAAKPEHQPRLNRCLNHFDEFLDRLLHRLLPKHLTQSPPPDRQIYYWNDHGFVSWGGRMKYKFQLFAF